MAAGTYAKGTSVPVERSRAEIERMLARYGADGFMSGWDANRAVIAFNYRGLMIRFEIPNEAKPAEQRRKWRVLGLVVKAKLESIESEVSTFEQEFLAWVVGPDGQTLGDRFIPQLANMETMPPLLPAPTNENRILPIEVNRA